MSARGERLQSVDALRGLVMVVMALDHVRDYFSAARFDPTDLARTWPALFLTRWVTHFCAPVFILLAGTSAGLRVQQGGDRRALARFLLGRGLWLVVLELTVVRLAWCFNLDYAHEVFVGVLWAIGWGLIVLAGLVLLPAPVAAAFALITIAGHNLLDPVRPEWFGGEGPLAWSPLAWLWIVLHAPNPPVLYPLVPWVGVVAAGWAGAPLLRAPAPTRRRRLLAIGLGMTAAFVLLRALNGYGDPHPWSVQGRPAWTLMSFLDTEKYPPSLCFLLMTLGPAIALLPLLERARGALGRLLVVFGRVPLFFYVLHLYLIHALVLVAAALVGRDPRVFCTVFVFFPTDWGFGLVAVYGLWAVVVIGLYPACRWFAAVKAESRSPWLAYL